jgi:anti-anti-sigma factor
MVLYGSSASAVVVDGLVSGSSSDRDRRGGIAAPQRLIPGARVVSLHGEYDSAHADDLVALLAGAMEYDEVDLIVDLRDVTFLGASTLRVLVRIRSVLGQQGRSLALRSPSRVTRRMLEICGLSDLVEVSPGAAQCG